MHDHLELELADPARSTAKQSEQAAGPESARRDRRALDPRSVLGLQRSVGNAGTSAYLQREEEDSPVKDIVGKGGGSPLDSTTRAAMEQQIGADFGDVRLHVDARSAESVQAAAYTVGSDVVVHPNHFQPGTPSAQRTLAHELTHVVQQRSGPVDGTAAGGGIKISDPSDRFEQEAERTAERVMSGAVAQRSVAGVSTPVVQREEEEEVQTLALQREGEEEESNSEEG